MSDAATAGPSLLLAQHDLAHREHQHLHRHKQRQHHKLHKKQDDAEATVVTEVVATISVVQQVNIDSNGNTFSVILLPASTDSSPASTDASPTTTTTTPSIPAAVSDVPSTVSSTTIGSESSNSAAQLPPSLSTSLSANAPAATPSILSTFSSLSATTNSTTLISSSSSLSSQTLSNATRLTRTSSKASLAHLTTVSSSSVIDPEHKLTSSSYDSVTTSLLPTSTDAGVFVAGGTGATGSGGSSASATAVGSGSKSDSEPITPTPVIIGSVVSSVAGAAVIILAILFIWRWKKGKGRNMLSLGSGAALGSAGVQRLDDGDAPQPSGGMVERRSFVNAVPAALASLAGYKRQSQKTERTISSTAGSERGFYRVSGRKLPSVLQSGGDGYGGGIDDVNHMNTLSGSSFYRDSQGFYGGPGSPSGPSFPAVLGISTQRDSGVPVSRPSPARTPVIEHGPFSPFPPPLAPPIRPDLLGRSHPSQDGSHTSRFTEEV